MNIGDVGDSILNSIEQAVRLSLIESGIDQNKAECSALSAGDRVRQDFAGCMVYIRKESNLKLIKRDKKIVDEFTGNNHYELSIKYSLSVQRIYKILKILGKKHVKNS